MLIQIPIDTTGVMLSKASNSSIHNIPDSVCEAFIISFIVLLIATFGKYLITRKTSIIDWGAMIIELPIDVCAIVSTIIASTKFEGERNVTMLALSAVIPILLCSYFRRIGMNLYIDKKWFRMIACGAADILIASIWILLIINILF